MPNRLWPSNISDAEVARQWRLLALQTRRLALFLQGSGQDEAMRRADRFERLARELEEQANEKGRSASGANAGAP